MANINATVGKQRTSKINYNGIKEFNNKWVRKRNIPKKKCTNKYPNLKQVYFAGGEPLMIKEHKQFIEEIIRQGYQDKILLRYNSNGILVDEDLIDLWSKFKKVSLL